MKIYSAPLVDVTSLSLDDILTASVAGFGVVMDWDDDEDVISN